MKTTIEVEGHEIVIDASEDSVSVSAVKLGGEGEDGEQEVVEEFTLELGEGGEDFEGGEEGDDEIQGFGEFDEEEDFEGGEEEEGEFDEDDLEDVEDEDETKLESYDSFIRKGK